ncbi:enoyl-CoA hydratase/isomerase family protein [Candidatus Acetothermia bacterium]|nr:enoyl-CoA hydratase/isomerase family protein [Candidatus Acetothermia bacterium]MBI3644047.1 enoyl-CoA hydratase/isomerase family protein [Candidatus Acetothermia bacterium]
MPYTNLHVEESRGVVTVTLNRPDVRNAFNAELISELTDCFSQLDHDYNLRAVVLAGAGSLFCAGADIQWMKDSIQYTEAQNREDALRMARMFQAIDLCPHPVIGRVQKAAFGGAVGLISVCDIVVADENAKFSFSEVRLGIVPAVISSFALRKIGLTHARRFFLTGEVFSAQTAKEIGLIHEVVPEAQLSSKVQELGVEILKSGPKAVREAKILTQRVPALHYEEALEFCAKTIARVRASQEGQEGLKAFLEKSLPSWSPKTLDSSK